MALDQETQELLLKIRADVTDLSTKMKQAQGAAEGVGDGMGKASEHAGQFGSKIGKALDPARSLDMAIAKFIKRVIGVGAIFRVLYGTIQTLKQSVKDFEAAMPDDKNVQAIKHYNAELLSMRVEIGSHLVPIKKVWQGLIVQIGKDLGLLNHIMSEHKTRFEELSKSTSSVVDLDKLKAELVAYSAETERLAQTTVKNVEYMRQGVMEKTTVTTPGLSTKELADRAAVEEEMRRKIESAEIAIQKKQESGIEKADKDKQAAAERAAKEQMRLAKMAADEVERDYKETTDKRIAAQLEEMEVIKWGHDEVTRLAAEEDDKRVADMRAAWEEKQAFLKEQNEVQKALMDDLHEFAVGSDQATYDKQMAQLTDYLSRKIITQQQYDESAAMYQAQLTKAQSGKESPEMAAYYEKLDLYSQELSAVQGVMGEISNIYAEHYAMVRQEEEQNIAATLANLQAKGASEQELAAMKAQLTAQGNARAKAAWEKQKKADLASAIIGTAVAVINALQTKPFYVGLIMAALAGVAGGIQIAKIAGQQYPGMAEGGVVRQGTTSRADDVPIRVSRGEYVSPAQSVDYYGAGVYEGLRRRSIPRSVFNGFALPDGRAVPSPRFAEGGMVGADNEGAEQQTTIVNFLDPNLMDRYLSSPRGKRSIVNVIRERSFDVQKALGG